MPTSSRSDSVGVGSKSLFCAVIDDLVYLSHGEHKLPHPAESFHLFQPQKTLRYFPICDDFGPMNLAATTRFIELDSRATTRGLQEAGAISNLTRSLFFSTVLRKRGRFNATALNADSKGGGHLNLCKGRCNASTSSAFFIDYHAAKI